MSSFEDDDGIIDLNAIASKSAPPRAPVAALFSETPPAISVDAIEASTAAAKGNGLKTGLMIGGGALVAMATIIGCVFAFRGETATPRTAAAIPPPPAVTAPPPATVSPPAAPAPAPASEESTDDAKPSAKKKASGAKHATGSVSKPAVAASKPAKPVAAADPCRCHGDFQCNIKCSAGR